MNIPPILISYFFLALSMALGGIYIGVTKPLTQVFPILLLAWLRYLFAMPFMISWFKKAPEEKPLDKKSLALLALMALIGSVLFSVFMLAGVKLTSSLSAGIVMAGIPAAVAILSRLFLKEHIAPRTIIAILLAISGIILLAIANISSTPQNTTLPANETIFWYTTAGFLLLIMSTFCEGSYVVIGKKLSGKISPKRVSAFMNLWGLIFTTPIGIYLMIQFDYSHTGWQIWLLLLFYALSSSVICVWSWMVGLKNVPATSAGIFTILIPIFATLTGIFIGEHFSRVHAIAFVLAISGLLLATWPQKPVIPCKKTPF